MCSDYDITLSMDFENQFSFLPSLHSLISLLQVENANTLSMKCSDVYLYESSLQPDQFGSLPKLQVRPKSLPWRWMLTMMMMILMILLLLRRWCLWGHKGCNWSLTFAWMTGPFKVFLYLAQIGTFFYEAIAMQRALSQQLISRVFWSVFDLVENLKVILRLKKTQENIKVKLLTSWTSFLRSTNVVICKYL